MRPKPIDLKKSVLLKVTAAAMMLLPVPALPSYTAEVAAYLGTWEGAMELDGRIYFPIGSSRIDGEGEVTLTITGWTQIEDTAQYRAEGNIKGSGEIDYNIGTRSFDFDRSFDAEDDVILDVSTRELFGLDVLDVGGISVDFDSTFNFSGDEVSGSRDFEGTYLGNDIEGTIVYALVRTAAPDISFQLDNEIIFGFTHNNEQWDFAAPSGFEPSEGSHNSSAGALEIQVRAADNVFAWWEGPRVMLTPTDDDTLLLARYRVGATNEDATATPAFRFRASTGNWEYTSELQINSQSNAALAPSAGNEQEYVQYLTPPEDTTRIRLFFDALNFGGIDSDNTELLLHEVRLYAANLSELGVERSERSYSFGSGETSGFREVDAGDSYGRPLFDVTGEGLSIQADSENPDAQIGFWVSGPETDDVTLEGNRLYRIRYFVSTTAASGEREEVPVFRARLNDGSLQQASLVHIDGQDSDSRVPVGGAVLPYDVYFPAGPELDGHSLRLAFDLIWVPDTGKSTDVAVVLEGIQIVSVPMP